MNEIPLEQVVRNVDVRLSKVEQILPTLATREEMHAAIRAAIEPLATREELRAAIAPLATRAEMEALRSELNDAIRAEGERARQHATVLYEDLRDDTRMIIEHVLALSVRVDALARR